jgi:hypothetical protein
MEPLSQMMISLGYAHATRVNTLQYLFYFLHLQLQKMASALDSGNVLEETHVFIPPTATTASMNDSERGTIKQTQKHLNHAHNVLPWSVSIRATLTLVAFEHK